MESEIIAKILIDKLICLSYKQHYVSKAEQNIGFHCSNYLLSTLTNPFLSQNFIYFEYDDLDSSQQLSHSSQLFFNTPNHPSNTWLEISQPENPTKDRDTSTLIEFTSLPHSLTFQEPIEDYLNTNSNLNQTSSTKAKFTRNSISKHSILIQPTQTQTRRASTRMSLIDLPSYPITLVDDDIKRNEDTPDIIALREEFEIEKKRILEEKRKIEAEKERERQIEQEKKIPKKGFNFNKVRFNINGELIAFKPIKLRDLSKDFYLTRTHIKNIGKLKNDNNDKKKQKEVIIERNSRLGDVAFPSTMVLPSSHKGKDTKGVFKKNDDGSIIQPAGSNYDIFVPEVGVSLTEGSLKKGGNKDFSKKFKKTSSIDFDKMLHEYIPILNKSKLRPQLTESNIYSPQLTSSHNRNLNVNNNLPKYDSTSNITAASGHNRSISLFNMSTNNPLLDGPNLINSNTVLPLSSVNPSSINSRLYRTSDIDFDSIKLGSNYRSNLTSLKYTLEEIADLDEGQFVLPSSTIGKGNKRTYKVVNNMKGTDINKNKDEIEVVNKFNADIMKNKHVEGNEFHTNKSALFRKPKKGNMIKELGKSIVMTKLPRSRKFNVTKYN